MSQVEFIKAKQVEAGRLRLWWRGDYIYEMDIVRDGKTVWHKWLNGMDQEAAEEEFAKVN